MRAGLRWIALGAALVGLSVLLAVGAFGAETLYSQYGTPRTQPSQLSWALRTATYERTDCADCHGPQAAEASTAQHAGLICETCHVPTVLHPGSVNGVVQALPAPTSALCATCHAQAAGRPAGFPQVDPVTHYPGASCLQCHDPHTSQAQSPPNIPHPLARLPACTVCHAPGGLKRFPQGHRAAEDSFCLACHRPGVLEP
ncbi:MAG TPA: multiheme c-type cytochrome [Candidatus Limnocylindrales bacterium]